MAATAALAPELRKVVSAEPAGTAVVVARAARGIKKMAYTKLLAEWAAMGEPVGAAVTAVQARQQPTSADVVEIAEWVELAARCTATPMMVQKAKRTQSLTAR